jgi:5'-phosphate synthase pdxT subunit
MSNKPIIGVFALQGAVEPHKAHIIAAGGEFRAVKTPEQFAQVDGFILPGGESTTMLKLIERFDLWDVLSKEFAAKPVWGICAGCILMAREVSNPQQKSFGLLPMSVQRNAYGRQLESHHTDILGYTVSFIRAPVIEKHDADVTVLASYQDQPVWVQKAQYMAATFHAEMNLAAPSPMHVEFIKLVQDFHARKAA